MPVGLTVAVIGGDRREQEICRLAAGTGAIVRAFGIPWPEGDLPGVARADTLAAALADAALCLLPLPLPAPDGTLYAPAAPAPIRPDAADFARMRRAGRIIAGSANAALRAAAAVPVETYGDDIAGRRERAVVVAEGAVGRVIAATERTIHGAQMGVLGNGVLGQAIAATFRSLGATVTVFARTATPPAVLALDRLAAAAPALDLLLSTIPAPVAAPDVLRRLPSHALVLDLAVPAGIAPAATAAGLRTQHARGLGERAPVTMGAIQWRQILALLAEPTKTGHVPSA